MAGPVRWQARFLLLPTLRCQASCSYCFGHSTGQFMSSDTLAAAVDFMAETVAECDARTVEVGFHGGEPLLASKSFWNTALESISRRFGLGNCRFSVQSNLWNLDDEFCEMFVKYGVEIGSSLDGPPALTDKQRGEGHSARTMRGIQKAGQHGIRVGCMATLTRQSLPHWREVVEFFRQEELGCVVWPTFSPLDGRDLAESVAEPGEYAEAFCSLFDSYADSPGFLHAPFLDLFQRAVETGRHSYCTFSGCYGCSLAFAPDGLVYPCSKFCGHEGHAFGNLSEGLNLAAIEGSPMGVRLAQRGVRVADSCGKCLHYSYCRGGCPYTAWAHDGATGVVDPMCSDYVRIWNHIRLHLLTKTHLARSGREDESSSPKQDGAIEIGPRSRGASPNASPARLLQAAQKMVAAHELALGSKAAAQLLSGGLTRSLKEAERIAIEVQQWGDARNLPLGDLVVQIAGVEVPTEDEGKPSRRQGMSLDLLTRIALEGRSMGFQRLVVDMEDSLPGEQSTASLRILGEIRRQMRPTTLAYRSSLNAFLVARKRGLLQSTVDEVHVQLDLRDVGLSALNVEPQHSGPLADVMLAADSGALQLDGGVQISLVCIVAAENQLDFEAWGRFVSKLQERSGIRDVRLRPAVSGTCTRCAMLPPVRSGKEDFGPADLLASADGQLNSCQLGSGLFVTADCEVFSCSGCVHPSQRLGVYGEETLEEVLASHSFGRLQTMPAKAQEQCRCCEYRYICGGACKALANAGLEPGPGTPACSDLQMHMSRICQLARQIRAV